MNTDIRGTNRLAASLLAGVVLMGVLSGCTAPSAPSGNGEKQDKASSPATTAATAPPASPKLSSDPQFTRHGSWDCAPEAGTPFVLELALDDGGTLVGAVTTKRGSSIGDWYSVQGTWMPSGTITLVSNVNKYVDFDVFGENGSIGGKLAGDKLALSVYFDRTGNTTLIDGNCTTATA